ncbi:hypothetical protein OZX68_06275 [Streptococcaceae bacterium ESL0729]|nr:hypothetical protein OZX68_06275 [Streptococcaceae bacterium ESL0729]
MNIQIILSILAGMLLGIVGMGLGFYLYHLYDENRYKKQLAIDKKLKELEVRNILNKKINELLNRPLDTGNDLLIIPQKDIKIPFYDYNFLKNFTSMYNLYLPAYFLETFFKDLSHRLATYSDEDDMKNGGYIFKDARIILENFSKEVTHDMKKKQKELEKLANIYPSILKKQYFDL